VDEEDEDFLAPNYFKPQGLLPEDSFENDQIPRADGTDSSSDEESNSTKEQPTLQMLFMMLLSNKKVQKVNEMLVKRTCFSSKTSKD